MSDAQQQIGETIKDNDVVLFMKGTANVPQCGFSATVATILDRLDVPFADINILLEFCSCNKKYPVR